MQDSVSRPFPRCQESALASHSSNTLLEVTLTQHRIPSMKVGVATRKLMPPALPGAVEMLHSCTCSVLHKETLRVLHIIISGWVGGGRNEEATHCASVPAQALFCHRCSSLRYRGLLKSGPQKSMYTLCPISFPPTLFWITPSNSSANIHNFPPRRTGDGNLKAHDHTRFTQRVL